MNMTGRDPRQKPRHARRILITILGAVLGIGASQATSWANQPGQAVQSAPSAKTEGTTSGSPLDSTKTSSSTMDQTYAGREADAKSLESFKGGDIVIIGSTGAVIVLLVILILVLA
jgi:hypothetical protein